MKVPLRKTEILNAGRRSKDGPFISPVVSYFRGKLGIK